MLRAPISPSYRSIHAKLFQPPLSPSSQIAEISLWIVTSPVSQRKPKVACIFPCLDRTFVIGRLIEENLCGDMQLRLCSSTKKDDVLTENAPRNIASPMSYTPRGRPELRFGALE
jgi:hypothetical protein